MATRRKTSAKAAKAASKVLRANAVGKASRTPSAAVLMQRRRRKPYTQIGIRRLACVRCGSIPTQQWNICADGNVYRPICTECDIAINRLVLEFIGDPDVEAKMEAYAERLRRSEAV